MASESRRDRPLRTCFPCRKRKIRCDKTRPSCSQCQKGQLGCAYDEEQHQRIEYQFIAETPGSTASASGPSQPRLGRLGYEEDSPTPARGYLSEQPGRRIRYVEPSFWAYDPNDGETIDTLLGDQTRFDMFDPLEGLENETVGTWTQQTSATVSEHGSSNAGKSGRNNFRGIRTTIPYRLTGDLAAPPPAFGNTEASTSRYQRRASTVLWKTLPPKPLCDQLLDFYITGYHPIAPVIHVPSFRAEYESLWKASPNEPTQPQGTSHFICLLLAILFAGAVACPSTDMLRNLVPEATRTREELETGLHARASRALRQASFPRTPSLETFTAYVILQATWMRVEEPLTTCAFIGLAYRVAQMLGLHRDPSHFSAIQPIVAEVRRRVWWFLIHIDIAVGLAAGLPPMIDLSLCDVKQVSELKEELVGTREGLEYEAQPHKSGGQTGQSGSQSHESIFSTSSILVMAKYKVAAINKEILSLIYGQKPITNQDLIRLRAKVKASSDELKTRINRIPSTPRPVSSSLSFHSRAALQNGESYLDSWARLYISLLTDRTWILACHPALKKTFTEIWRDIEPEALGHCRDYLRKVAQLSCFEEFQYFHWAWPGNHQPLLAIMTLLTELRKNPRSTASPSYREVIDIVFALLGPGGGLVAVVRDVMRQRPLTEGGSESWDLLWRFRSRAWRAAGLDPHVLWTREQALENLYKAYDDEQQQYGQGSQMHAPERAASFDFDAYNAATPAEASSHTMGTGLVDPNTPLPMPNVDMSFWDQMIEEHGQMDLDLGNYGDFDLNLDNN